MQLKAIFWGFLSFWCLFVFFINLSINYPLRPIVSNRGPACHPLSRFLVISPHHMLRTLPTSWREWVMLPFVPTKNVGIDVVRLFTKVPTDDTLAVVLDKLAADPLLEGRTCVVETTHFRMGSDIYRPEEGLATGSPLSPVLANIYMEYFEEIVLGSTSLKLSMGLRYIDETFILWFHQKDVRILLDYVNWIRSSVQFTMEKAQDIKLPFLDVLITRTEQRFKSSVHRKSTFTEQDFNFNSHHQYNRKKGVVRYLKHQAKAVSSDADAYQEDMISLRHSLHRNNYPEYITSTKPG